MQACDRLIVALDRSSRDDILRLADQLHGAAGAFKIGLPAFIANGPSIVREIVARGERVFLDLKIHDIPNTAQRAVAEAADLGAAIVTIHIAGGEAMMRACVGEPSPGLRPPSPAQRERGGVRAGDLLVAGVTILTSLDEVELQQVGFPGTLAGNAVRLARLAQACGLRAVVTSPREIAAIREACGSDLV